MTGARAGRTATLATELAEDLVAYRTGDREAVGRLVRRATPLLWHIARASGADPATAEDAVQNGLLALVRRADSIQDPQAVLRWLIVTVRREVSQLGRATARTELRPEPLDTVAAPEAAQPEPAVLTRERDRALWRSFGELSERCQQLLRIVAFADKPDYAAIGEALDMKMGSIGPTRGRCLDKLRALLAADPGWDGA